MQHHFLSQIGLFESDPQATAIPVLSNLDEPLAAHAGQDGRDARGSTSSPTISQLIRRGSSRTSSPHTRRFICTSLRPVRPRESSCGTSASTTNLRKPEVAILSFDTSHRPFHISCYSPLKALRNPRIPVCRSRCLPGRSDHNHAKWSASLVMPGRLKARLVSTADGCRAGTEMWSLVTNPESAEQR